MPASVIALILLVASSALAQPPSVARMNAAVTRVFAIRGVRAVWATSPSNPSFRGPDAWWDMEYGTGVALRPDLIVTAKHVVWGSDLVVVMPSGSTEAFAGRVVYSDPQADFAFVSVSGRLPHVAALTAHPSPPAAGADLWLSGYPLDWHESSPAVARATLSRVAADGRLTLDSSVNPGNSGGPVFDEHGNLHGIVVSRGDPSQGVAGLAMAEPASRIAPIYRASIPRTAPAFTPFERAFASALAVGLRGPLQDTRSLQSVIDTFDASMPAVQRAMIALFSWSVLRHYLWRHDTNSIAALPPEERAPAEAARDRSIELARGAIAEAPYLRTDYSFLVVLLRANGDPSALAERIPHPDAQ